MSMERTPTVHTGRRANNLFFYFLRPSYQHPVHLQKVSTFSLKVGQYCPTHPPDDRGRHLLKMPQQGSIFSYISPGSSLRKSMTGKLVYNFPLMSMHFTSLLLRVPNSNDNYTVTFTRITVHKRCSFLRDMER